MSCDELLDTIEPIAAGELTPSAAAAAHLASCESCAHALESARRVDRLLRGRAAPPAPAQFTSRVMNRVHRARWRAEQIVDWGFNAALVTAAIGIVGGLWIVMQQSGLAMVSSDAIELLGPGMLVFARRVAPALPLYGAATLLLGTALAVWWWAEREV
jgi:anti-sigma factor RsiW